MRAANASLKSYWLSAISRQISDLWRKADAKKAGAAVGKIKSNPSTPTTPTQAANAFFQSGGAGGASKDKSKENSLNVSELSSGPGSPGHPGYTSMHNSSHEDLLAAAAKKLLTVAGSVQQQPQQPQQHTVQSQGQLQSQSQNTAIISQSVNSQGQTLTNKPSFIGSPLLTGKSPAAGAGAGAAGAGAPKQKQPSQQPQQQPSAVPAPDVPTSPRGSIHHDVDLFGEMDVFESAHDHESFSSDEEIEPNNNNNNLTDEEKDSLLKKTSSGNITAMGQKNPQQQQQQHHYYVPSRHIPSLPINSPKASPTDHSKLLRAASMKEMPSPSSNEPKLRLYSPSFLQGVDALAGAGAGAGAPTTSSSATSSSSASLSPGNALSVTTPSSMGAALTSPLMSDSTKFFPPEVRTALHALYRDVLYFFITRTYYIIIYINIYPFVFYFTFT